MKWNSPSAEKKNQQSHRRMRRRISAGAARFALMCSIPVAHQGFAYRGTETLRTPATVLDGGSRRCSSKPASSRDCKVATMSRNEADQRWKKTRLIAERRRKLALLREQVPSAFPNGFGAWQTAPGRSVRTAWIRNLPRRLSRRPWRGRVRMATAVSFAKRGPSPRDRRRAAAPCSCYMNNKTSFRRGSLCGTVRSLLGPRRHNRWRGRGTLLKHRHTGELTVHARRISGCS